MDIDFIKWLCDKAEGFEYGNRDDLIYKGYPKCQFFSELYYSEGYHPLLLQRAIEGVNRDRVVEIEIGFHGVTVNKWNSEVFDDTKDYYLDDMTIDQAKESALMYIYEQENSK